MHICRTTGELTADCADLRRFPDAMVVDVEADYHVEKLRRKIEELHNVCRRRYKMSNGFADDRGRVA